MTRQVNFNGYIQRLASSMLIWAVMAHEFGHLISLRLIDVPGEIRSTGLNLTWSLEPLTGWRLTFFCVAGGLMQAIYGLDNMRHESDNETWLAYLTITLQGLTYMWFEEPRLFALGALISLAITALIILLLTIFEVIWFD